MTKNINWIIFYSLTMGASFILAAWAAWDYSLMWFASAAILFLFSHYALERELRLPDPPCTQCFQEGRWTREVIIFEPSHHKL